MGLERANKQGKQLGQSRGEVDANEIAELRNLGRSWREIGKLTGVTQDTSQRAVDGLAKNPIVGEAVNV